MSNMSLGDGLTNRSTMMDVAQLAGVSHQTVSRVLNGSANVSHKTVERVNRAVEQLGYKPNPAARALVTRRSMSLGLVGFGVSQFGPATALFGIAEAARDHGYSTNLVNLADVDFKSVRKAIDHLLRDSVDGIIVIAPVAGAAAAVNMLPPEVPLVRFEPGLDNGTTCVSVDEVLGARLATRHLLDLGHETVWHISGPPGWLGTEARVRGWQRELSAAKRVAHEPIVGDWSSASGFRAGLELAKEPEATAVFVANDQMALGVMKALRESGRDVPGDISVVGFDDIPEASYFTPALSTVRLDFTEVGHRCVKHLLEIIRGGSLAPQEAVPPELLARESSAPPNAAR